ncbi:MAG: hypothetical protein AAF526_05630 [Pseudomonadota bacterium]
MRLAPLATEERAAEFVPEIADGPGERGLGDMAELGGPREVQLLGEDDKVADLVQFYPEVPPYRVRQPSIALNERRDRCPMAVVTMLALGGFGARLSRHI